MAGSDESVGSRWPWGIAALLACGLALWFMRTSHPVAYDAASDVPPYVGSQACAACHPKVVEAWRGSAHERNMARPTEATVVGDFGGAVYRFAGTESRMFRDERGYHMDFHDADGRGGELRVDWVVGFARHQIYLHEEADGRLQVLPTFWSVERGRWFDALEGPIAGEAPLGPTDLHYWRNHGRTFQRNCVPCHASRFERRYDATSNRYDSRFEPTIECEACHGPARDHVARWRALDGVSAAAPLPPAKSADVGASIEGCAVCHASKQIYQTGFQPGRSFYDYFVPTVWGQPGFFVDGRSQALNYRYVDYLQSGCYRAAKERMDCGYCHPPHDPVAVRGKTVSAGNRVCTGCHVGHKTRLAAHTHHGAESEGSRCVGCHMPPLELSVEMTVRDHSIGSPLPKLTRDHGVPNACGACHGDRPVQWAVDHVEAWYGGTERFRAYADRIEARVQVLAQSFGEGPPPVEALVEWLDDPERTLIERASAAHLLERAGLVPDEVLSPDLRGRATDALLRHRGEAHPLIRFHVYRSLSAFAAPRARAAVREALGDPRRTIRVEAYTALSFLEPEYLEAQRDALAGVRAEYEHRVVEVEGDNPDWKRELAMQRFRRGDPARAEALLREAVAIAPRMPGPTADLARFLLASGRPADAERFVSRLESVAPDHELTGLARGEMLVAEGRPAAAVGLYERMLARGQRSPDVHAALAAARRIAEVY